MFNRSVAFLFSVFTVSSVIICGKFGGEITFVYRPTYCNAADDVRFALAVEIIDIDLRMEGTGIGLCAVRALSTRSRGVCGIAVTIRLARCSFGIFDIAHGFAFRSGYADGSVTQIAVERQRFAF